MTSRTPKLTGTAAVAWLALATWCAPAFAQDIFSLHATLPQATSGVREAQADSPPPEAESILPQHLCGAIPIPMQLALVLVAPVVLPSSPAFAQNSPNPPEK